MRVGFLGKGGSGKTTLSTLFSLHAVGTGKNVLTIDADVNVHLGDALRVKPPPFLSEHHTELFNMLEGRNTFFADWETPPELGSIPPTLESALITLSPSDLVLSKFGSWNGNHVHLAVGNYEDADVGGACFHYKLNSLQLLLHHLMDQPDEVVIADTTAGVDNVGTSLYMAYDLNVFCVEATLKSVSVCQEFLNLTKGANLNIVVLCNKWESDSDLKFIREKITSVPVLKGLGFQNELLAADQGEQVDLKSLANEQSELLNEILVRARHAVRCRNKYMSQLTEVYLKECNSWWNSYYGKDLGALLNSSEMRSYP